MESLSFAKRKGYCLKLPLTLSKGCIAADTQWSDVVTVSGRVPVIADIGGFCDSHVLNIQEQDEFKSFEVTETKPPKEPLYDVCKFGRDFELRFGRWKSSLEVGIHALKLQNQNTSEDNSLVALFLTPPRKTEEAMPRFIYFLLDRSCAMAGQSFVEATRALGRMLSRVGERDSFNVAVFDGALKSWERIAKPGTGDNKRMCRQWLKSFDATTHSSANVNQALRHVLAVFGIRSSLQPSVVLITASGVDNPRDICTRISDSDARVFTLAIGPFVDDFFLNVLARVSRGHSEVVRNDCDVSTKVKSFIQKFEAPLLTDILVAVRSSDDFEECHKLECYSTPARDLYAAAPVSLFFEVSADISRVQQLVVYGVDANDENVKLICDVPLRQNRAVEWMAARQKLEYLATECWLQESDSDTKTLESKAAALSVTHSMPLASFSTLVCFQMDRTKAPSELPLASELLDTALPSYDAAAGSRQPVGSESLSDESEEKETQCLATNTTLLAAAANSGTLMIVPTSAASSGSSPPLDAAFADEYADTRKRTNCLCFTLDCRCCLAFYIVGGCANATDFGEDALDLWQCCELAEGCEGYCQVAEACCLLCCFFCKS